MCRREVLIAALVLPFSTVHLRGKNHGNGGAKRGEHNGRDDDEADGHDCRCFRHDDYAAIQRYYSGPRELPPGLRKKYYRTGTLPPGWQKKIRPFPPELVRVLPPPPPNCDRGYIEGVAIVYDRTTRIILDSIDLVAAIRGR